MRAGAAIAGIGATEFSKRSGRSEMQLALEAVRNALADAGLSPHEVDGLVTFTQENNPEVEISRNLGMHEIRYMARSPYGGGGACATIQHAVLAINAGVANVVVCYRAFNERSESRFGTGELPAPRTVPTAEDINWGWYLPYGLSTAAGMIALFARRYMHEYGASSEDFGRIAVIDRQNAATNPAAWFYGRPITLEQHQLSRWIVAPLHLLDCCQESDGGVAIVVTSAARARNLRQRPVLIEAVAQGCSAEQEMMTNYYRPDIAELPEMSLVARQLWKMSDLKPADIQCAILYDHFTPLVLAQLESLGFCGRGDARHYVKDGHLDLSGSMPLNPHGGLLGEAYIHGLNGINEAVRQIRGTAVNQVQNVEHVLVTGGTGVPTSAVILGGG